MRHETPIASSLDGQPATPTCHEPSNPPLNPLPVSVDDPKVLAQLRALVCAVVWLADLQEDCLQEAVLFLLQTSRERPGKSMKWYLKSCSLFLRNLLRLGRSVDSIKRRHFLCRIEPAEDSGDYSLAGELISEVTPSHHASASDVLEQLNQRLDSREKEILRLSLAGNCARETARQLRISPSVVCESNRRIRAAALEIGFSPSSHFEIPITLK